MKLYCVIGIMLLFLFPFKMRGGNGPDVVRATMFLTYAQQAKVTLKAQDAALNMNLTGHKFLGEEMEKITDFQKQFNNYLNSFGDILSIAAEIYGIYYEVNQALKNIDKLKDAALSCPANLVAVALSERKNNIYVDVIENGIQIVNDIRHLVPLSKDKDKNAKMTEKERIECMGKIRKSLRALNYKMRKMNRLFSYTTLLDSWYELKGNPPKTRSMREIVTSCHKGWMRKATSVKYNK